MPTRIILDHVSIQWGRWDTVDMTDATDVTLQFCIIGPGVAPHVSRDDQAMSPVWTSKTAEAPIGEVVLQRLPRNVVAERGEMRFERVEEPLKVRRRLLVVLADRLKRRACSVCRQATPPTPPTADDR